MAKRSLVIALALAAEAHDKLAAFGEGMAFPATVTLENKSERLLQVHAVRPVVTVEPGASVEVDLASPNELWELGCELIHLCEVRATKELAQLSTQVTKQTNAVPAPAE